MANRYDIIVQFNNKTRKDIYLLKDKLINLYHKFLEVLKNCFDKLWGDDLPDIDTLFPPALYTASQSFKLYEKKQKKLACRRFFVFIFLICILVFVKNSIQDAIYAIKNIPAFVCWNKPVCIYRGAKLKYPITFDTSYNNFISLNDNGDFLLAHNQYYKYFFLIANDRGKMRNIPFYLYLKSILGLDEEFILFTPKRQFKVTMEKFDAKKNRFSKIDLNKDISNTESIKQFFANNSNNKIYFSEPDCKNLISGYYDLNFKEFTKIETNTSNIDSKNCVFLKNYNENPLIVNCNKIADKYYEELYFLNLSTLKLEPFTNFAQTFPYEECKYIFLKNGKFLKIFETTDTLNDGTKQFLRNSFPLRKTIWSHIEIYDPKSNMFYVEKRPVAKDNILKVKYENGDILFLNEKSSFLFKNKTNEFIDKTSENTNLINDIKKLLIIHLKYEFRNKDKVYSTPKLSTDISIYELPQKKFLILKKNEEESLPENYKTIYVDYENKIVTEGPNLPFLQLSGLEKNVILDDKRTAIIGTNEVRCSNIVHCPSRYIYIVKVNKNYKYKK